jgi:hypothetical protein
MISNLEAHVIATIGLLASLGLGYIYDRAYSKQQTPEPHDTSDGLSDAEDIPSTVDAVPQLEEHVSELVEEQPCIEPVEQPIEQTYQPPDLSAGTGSITSTRSKRPEFDYRHELWPSPRPVNFVKALVKGDHVRIEGRISHGKAIEILASRAKMKPEQFLKVDPLTYTKSFMPHQYNAAVLLGQSIQRLEDFIRQQQNIAISQRQRAIRGY